jgi:hypothetical protein
LLVPTLGIVRSKDTPASINFPPTPTINLKFLWFPQIVEATHVKTDFPDVLSR